MGYNVRTVNLNITSIPFRKVSSHQKWDVVLALEHDFRQYDALNKPLPRHIRRSDVENNVVVYVSPWIVNKLGLKVNVLGSTYKFGELPQLMNEVGELHKIFAEINEKEKERRRIFEEKTKVSINANPFVGFIINFSKLAQKEIVDVLGVDFIIQRVKDFTLDFFENLMGTQVLYLVCHLDESAIHFHGLIRNSRTYKFRYKNKEELKEDPYFNYLLEKWRIVDLKETIVNGIFKTFSGTFTSNVDELKKANTYKLPFSFLQDVPANAFSDLGFERGKSKAERLEEGEPLWKLISRDVKTLHEDLPREINAKKEELRFLTEVIAELNEEKERLLQEIEEIRRTKGEEEEILFGLREQYETLLQEIRELEKTKEELTGEIAVLEEKLLEVNNEISIIEDEKVSLEKELVEKKGLYSYIQSEIETLQKEQEVLKDRVGSLEKEREMLEKVLSELRREKEELIDVLNKLNERKVFLVKDVENEERRLEELSQIKHKLTMRINSLKEEEEELWKKIEDLRKEEVCSRDELEYVNLINRLLSARSLDELEGIEEEFYRHKFIVLLQRVREHIEKVKRGEVFLEEAKENLKEVMKLFEEKKRQIEQYLQEKEISQNNLFAKAKLR